ncbi:polyprenyl synthetase family protein [Desulfurispora thermophila]|uniref:polyprenyl synthetase family protein n=1 Tax=Desulfurispora thermophila TaxID=265470 RepID=UPI00036446CE|nr:polyprenyl synthetase family protein [Desulfurispora thermophila]
MLAEVLRPIRPELQQVAGYMQKHFYIKAGYLGDFAHVELSHLDSQLRPALVVLVAKLFGEIDTRVLSLAGVVQFIHLAARVHDNINEDQHDSDPLVADPREGSQYPVLVGDYFYGRFFTTLCEAGIECFLQPLAEVICQINTGGILRLKRSTHMQHTTWPEQQLLVERETASLIALGCRLGAQLAGASEKQSEQAEKFGFNLGMNVGLTEKGAWFEQAVVFLRRALEILQCLPGGESRVVLRQLVQYITQAEQKVLNVG